MSGLVVEVPAGAERERSYALAVVLGHMLGVEFQVRVTGMQAHPVRISSPGAAGVVEVADVFFPAFVRTPLHAETLPPSRLDVWEVPERLNEPLCRTDLPVLYGKRSASGAYFERNDAHSYLGVDVFGTAFMMLARYEEAVLEDRDKHGRFRWAASIAARAEIWRRPIVDEYVELLGVVLRQQWPALTGWTGQYRLLLSHDVDRLFSVSGRSWSDVLRSSAADLVIRRDPKVAVRRVASRASSASGAWRHEPVNTFDFMLTLAERMGLKSAFYFIPQNTAPQLDGDYDLGDSRVQGLMRAIHERGHEVGLHGSYRSFDDDAMLSAESRSLRDTAERLGIRQSSWGGRQHYLRWSVRATWAAWANSALDYDSTLGFAEHAGFRCGTCREYPVFDLASGRSLPLTERPLIAMDVTLLSDEYMGLSAERSVELVRELAATCRRFRGNFTLLWHNTSVVFQVEQALYETVLRAAS